ncbi:uncharacterized protein UTRI_04616_B [Ustilago trichophora]|uniref:Uncharacterized protein n=1 Tax=Ustilago trichophora TaxID=86804 RepID=A0A5C3EQF6_9BASI|nr:uncharacterized protein UTRI_04616_B [Ustilago trichophora]
MPLARNRTRPQRGRGESIGDGAESSSKRRKNDGIHSPSSSSLSSIGETEANAWHSESEDEPESLESVTQLPSRVDAGQHSNPVVVNANQSAESSQSEICGYQDGVDSREGEQALRQQLRGVKEQVNRLMERLANSQAEQHAIVQTLHWQDAIIKSMDATGESTVPGNKPPLPPLLQLPKRGGGAKPNKDLEAPFRKEICRRMGLKSKDPLPPFEENPPTLYGVPVLRLDWSKPASCSTGLVQEIVTELCQQDAGVRQRVEELGGHWAAVETCMASLQRLFRDWRQQERDANDPDRKVARDAKRRRINRARRKCDKRTAILDRNDTLWCRYHRTSFAIPEAASVEVTDAEATDESNHEAGAKSSSSSIGLTRRLVGLSGGTNGGGGGGTSGGGGASDGAGGASQGASQGRAMRKVVPSWRSLELHEALQQVDRRREEEKSVQLFPPTQLRQRLESHPIQYPPIDAPIEPLSKSIERWMVSQEFARLFPSAVQDVSRNTILAEAVNPAILDQDQWGQHPPYEVQRPMQHVTHQSSDEDHCNPFHGSDNSPSREDEEPEAIVPSSRGQERILEASPSTRPIRSRRRH